MSLRKLYSFVLVLTVAGFATVGTLNVQIKEYEVLTPRSRQHDPALAPDGSLWYTGLALVSHESANARGRVSGRRNTDGDGEAEALLSLGEREIPFAPAANAAIHGEYGGVPHFLEIVGGQGGAIPSSAVQD
jgi:hypothetical protein